MSLRMLVKNVRLSHSVSSRDAEKGDEPKARSKCGPTRRNKRALQGSEDLQESEEEDAQHRALAPKTVAKKAKVRPAISLATLGIALLDTL